VWRARLATIRAQAGSTPIRPTGGWACVHTEAERCVGSSSVLIRLWAAVAHKASDASTRSAG